MVDTDDHRKHVRTGILAVVCIVLIAGVCILALLGGEQGTVGSQLETTTLSKDTQMVSDDGAGEIAENDGDTATGELNRIAPAENADCPIVFDDAALMSTRNNSLGKGWTYETAQDIDEAMESTLVQLDESGYELVCDTALDLFGRAWGCIVKRDDTVLLVHMASPVIATGTDEGRALRVTVVLMETEDE